MKIYLADLGHYTIKLTNSYTPLGIGYLASFTQKNIPSKIDIKLFRNPNIILNAIEKSPPDILGITNYSWCQSVSEVVMEYYKRHNKNGCTISGGPNFPKNEINKIRQYLIERPYLDFYAPNEGEIPFLNVAKTVLEHGKDFLKLKTSDSRDFDGTYFLTNDNKLVGNNLDIIVEDLNDIPSPYLNGLFDQFIKDGLYPLIETQRGCPFSCTFCNTGLDKFIKGRHFSIDRLKKEIEYITDIVPDPSKAHLCFADTNYGMYDQDLLFTKWLAKHTEKTGFPLFIETTTGKGRSDLVLETVLAHPKLVLTNSVQSLDDEVLKIIKRKNLPMEKLKYSQEELNKTGKICAPELIVGLPGETRDSHVNTIRRLIKEVGSFVYQNTLILLPGTEIYDDKHREEYKFMSRFRIIPTALGEYNGKKTFEIEEVSVASKDMTHEEYLEMRELYFFVNNINNNIVYRPLVRYLTYLDDDAVEFFLYLMKKHRINKDSFANKIVSNYLMETENELFISKQDIIDKYSDEENYKKLIEGKEGKNLAHTYRTLCLLNAKEWAQFITENYILYLKEKYNKDDEIINIAEAIVSHILGEAECQYKFFNKRSQIPSRKDYIKADLEYDVPRIFSENINKKTCPKITKSKVVYKYYMKDDAIKYIASLPENLRIVDLVVTVLRMDQSYIFPVSEKI